MKKIVNTGETVPVSGQYRPKEANMNTHSSRETEFLPPLLGRLSSFWWTRPSTKEESK